MFASLQASAFSTSLSLKLVMSHKNEGGQETGGKRGPSILPATVIRRVVLFGHL